MVQHNTLLVMLVQLVDHIPTPPQVKQGRGRPTIYPERLFLKALVIMIVKHLHSRVRGRVLVAQEHQPLLRSISRW